MTVKTQAELKAKFETRKVPIYQDFVDLVESILHAQLGNFPDPLPAVSGKNLKDIGDALPDPLPARDGKNLYNINPQEYNIPSGITPSYASANTFVVTGDYTSGAATVAKRIFLVGRRLRLTIAGSYTYTDVLSASYNAGSDITTVTTANNMPGNQLTACAVGILTPVAYGGLVGTVATHADTEYVHLAGAETIPGEKTLTGNLYVDSYGVGSELRLRLGYALVANGGVGIKSSASPSAPALGLYGYGGVEFYTDAGMSRRGIFGQGLMLDTTVDKGAGTLNAAAGIYDNGVRVMPRGFQAWETKADSTVYQAATDGFVCATGYWTTGAHAIEGLTDSANPPTITRSQISTPDSAVGVQRHSVTFPVRKNEYWKTLGALAVYWIPAST